MGICSRFRCNASNALPPYMSFVVLAVVLTAAGCGSSSSSAATATSSGGATSETALPATTTIPATTRVGQVTFTDDEGYEYGLAFDFDWRARSTSIANSEPGRAEIETVFNGTASLQNKTPGRNASAAGVLDFIALFSAQRPMCEMGLVPAQGHRGLLSGVPGVPDGKYCVSTVGATRFRPQQASQVMQPDETITVPVIAHEGGSTEPVSVTESDAPTLTDDINKGPDGWLVIQMDNEDTVGSWDPFSQKPTCFFDSDFLYAVQLSPNGFTRPVGQCRASASLPYP